MDDFPHRASQDGGGVIIDIGNKRRMGKALFANPIKTTATLHPPSRNDTQDKLFSRNTSLTLIDR